MSALLKTIIAFGLGGAAVNVTAYHLIPKMSAGAGNVGWYLVFAIIGVVGGWVSLFMWSLTGQKNPTDLSKDPLPGDWPWKWWQRWAYIALMAAVGAVFEVLLPYMMAQYGHLKTMPPGILSTLFFAGMIFLAGAEIIGMFGLYFERFPVRGE